MNSVHTPEEQRRQRRPRARVAPCTGTIPISPLSRGVAKNARHFHGVRCVCVQLSQQRERQVGTRYTRFAARRKGIRLAYRCYRQRETRALRGPLGARYRSSIRFARARARDPSHKLDIKDNVYIVRSYARFSSRRVNRRRSRQFRRR